MNLLFHTFIVHFLFEQVTTVETVEGGIHGEELWGVEGQADGGDSQQSGGRSEELDIFWLLGGRGFPVEKYSVAHE